MARISLDRITLVGGIEYDWQKDVMEYRKEQGLNNLKAPYKYYMQLEDNSYIQFDAVYPDMAFFRIDFNPNKCDVRTIKLIKEKMKLPKVTRVDIAIDIIDDINNYFIIDSKGLKMFVILSKDKKTETVYLGSKGSDILIRVYDKRKQLKKEGEIITNELMRIEVVRRYKDGQSINEILEENLFDSVILLEKTGKLEYRALIEYLSRHPECIGELSRRKKQNLRRNMNQQNKLILKDIYNHAREDLRKQIEYITKREYMPIMESFRGVYYQYVQDNYQFRVIGPTCEKEEVSKFEQQSIFS